MRYSFVCDLGYTSIDEPGFCMICMSITLAYHLRHFQAWRFKAFPLRNIYPTSTPQRWVIDQLVPAQSLVVLWGPARKGRQL